MREGQRTTASAPGQERGFRHVLCSPVLLSSWILVLTAVSAAPARTLAAGGVQEPLATATSPGQASLDSTATANSDPSAPPHVRAATALARARERAAADDHAAAIAAYREAFALDLRLGQAYATELGDQLVWNDQPEQALRWYRQRIETAPTDLHARLGLARALSWIDRTGLADRQYRTVLHLDPGNLEARRGLARMLAWQDRLEEAQAAYETLLADEPDDLDTRLEHAQVVNWRGRHETAVDLYRGILEDHPSSLEARLGLAQALRWMGKPGSALLTLGPVAATPQASSLAREIRWQARPAVGSHTSFSHDSDDVDILQQSLMVSWTPQGTTGLEVGVVTRRLEQGGQPTIDGVSLRLGGGLPFTSRLELSGFVVGHRFTTDAPLSGVPSTQDLDWMLVGYDTWLTWRPTDRLRVDVSSDRGFLPVPRALGREIDVTRVGLSADWHLGPRTTLSPVVRAGTYGDSNRQLYESLALRRRFGGRTRLELTPSITAFQFGRVFDHGYWNPLHFWNGALEVRLVTPLRAPRLRLVLSTTGGVESDEIDTYVVGGVGGSLSYDLAARLRAELSGGANRSRLTSASGGYNLGWVQLGLRVVF